MIEKKRIVITGVGCISSVGNSLNDMWTSLINGKSGIKPITLFDSRDYKAHFAGEAHYNACDFGFTVREATLYVRSVLHAVSAAQQAVMDSGIDFLNRDNYDVCVIVGTGIGGIDNIENASDSICLEGPSKTSPFLVPSGTPDVSAHTIAMRWGIHGASFGVNTACASGNDAIATAFKRLQLGNEQIAITGGTEAAVCRISVAAFGNMRALSSWDGDGDCTKISRPFDRDRSGFVIAEGAGIVVLETLEHALSRGAKIYAEIIGCGQSTDAYHITAPEPTGKFVVKAMQFALADAQIPPDHIDYINAHGTSTTYNDLSETLAIKTVFKEHAKKLCVSSTKSMTGHLIGGCGGIEAIVSCMSLKTGIVPPTINYTTPDPDCDLDYVPNIAREINPKYVMSNNFGFGGHNTVLIFKKY